MKAVLCALNAKYVHTNLAVRYIAAYASAYSQYTECVIVEDTVHAESHRLLGKILEHQPNIVAFSAYIWNISVVLELCRQIRAAAPAIQIVLGGPEVSYNPASYLSMPWVDFVQCGEGEKPMTALFDAVAKKQPIPKHLGICYRANGEIVICAPYYEPDLGSLESPYTDEYVQAVSGRLAYFEASRGCPFSCAFCLSGAYRGVRNFDMAYVKRSLLALWNSGAKTVKFVDRTFNADYRRADEIIAFILEKAPRMPKVCFHFEIAADIMKESTLSLLSRAPKGLFQIEAGLQSFHPETLRAIERENDVAKVCQTVRKILSFGNIHTHVDLIAGLPYEDFESFRNSFHQAYAIGAHMLQLGFLKLLHGSKLREDAKTYNIEFEPEAPYTVKSTRWLTEQERKQLEDVEDANEKIYNSHRFELSLAYVLSVCGKTPFDLFLRFGKRDSMPLDDYTNELFSYFSAQHNVDKSVLRDLMCCDRLRTNNSGRLPACLKVSDKRLGEIARKLNAIPKAKGAKRAVCILYSEHCAVYADYEKGQEPPYDLYRVPLGENDHQTED